MKRNKIIHIILMVVSIFFIILSVKSVFSGISNIELNEYFEKYGSEKFGTIAYYLNRIRFCTMFIWIIGIWIGSYIKKKNNLVGRIVKVMSIVLLIITQLLPLLYILYIR
ncbi:MAG: hypothetical protein V8R72_00255 [Clostridia bacterium]